MKKQNPNEKTFITTMQRLEKTLERFLASAEFEEALITYANHSYRWHYWHPEIKVRLLTDKWEVSSVAWNEKRLSSNGQDCFVALPKIKCFSNLLAEIGEQRRFYDILREDPKKVCRVAETLYAQQESEIKQRTREHFQRMKQNGYMD